MLCHSKPIPSTRHTTLFRFMKLMKPSLLSLTHGVLPHSAAPNNGDWATSSVPCRLTRAETAMGRLITPQHRSPQRSPGSDGCWRGKRRGVGTCSPSTCVWTEIAVLYNFPVLCNLTWQFCYQAERNNSRGSRGLMCQQTPPRRRNSTGKAKFFLQVYLKSER